MGWIITATLFCLSLSLARAACPSDCNWNGRCQLDKCKCFAGFYGNTCDGDCGCGGHGVCASDQTCACDDGWRWSAADRQCVWDCHCDNGAACIGPHECGCSHQCQHGACRNAQCVCWEGYKGEDCSQYDANIMMNKGVAVGMNIGGISYYSSEVKFVDIHKQSQAWLTQRDGQHSWDTKEQSKIHWRPDGYPASLESGEKVVQLMLRGFAQHEEQGNFTVLYDGDGVIELGLTQEHILYDGKGRIVVKMPNIGKGGFTLTIHKTNPANPVRNIRVLIHGYENIHERFPFHPVFLENLKRYSEIRFMDFIHTNGHTPEPTTWQDRRLTDYYTQAGDAGGSIEYMIQLANTLGANPWFCMPHAATDDYVRNFAQLVKKTLRPDLTVYLEYSNEVWNGIFRQTRYAQEQGVKLHLDSASWKAGMLYYGHRAAEVMDIWKQVYGSSADSKLYPVYAWQTGYHDYYRQAVAGLGDKMKRFKAMALTGYFNCDNAADKHPEIVNMTMAEIQQQLCVKDIAHMEGDLHYFLNLSKSHGLQLVMYEGGPGVMQNKVFTGGAANQAITDKAVAFNKDSHMEKPIVDIMDTWNRLVTQDPGNKYPGGLFNYFSYTSTPSKYGSWGMLEYTGEDPSTVVKFRAVQNFITSHYKNNPLGPKCSYVKSRALSYGCYQQGNGVFKCGQTDDDGRTWQSFPSLKQQLGEYLVLDGYNPRTTSVYVRLTDSMGANTYHVYNTRTQSWSSPTGFAYYEALASPNFLPRSSNGVYHGLDAHAKCV